MEELRHELSFDEKLNQSLLARYGHAVLAIAGVDGELGKSERDYVLEAGIEREVDEEVLESWRQVDWQAVELRGILETLRTELSEPMRRLFIFDAAHAARADGVIAAQERIAIENAGETLGLDASIVESILALVDLEESAKVMRRGLLMLQRRSSHD